MNRPSMTGPRTAGSILALLVGWIGAGCGEGGGAASAGGKAMITDSAGIPIVENTASGLWTGEDRWSVHEVARIGAAAGDPAFQFGQVAGIAPLADGRIAVLDQQARELRIFTADGEHLRTVGGPGSGPGELAPGAGPILLARGDTLLVPDVTNQRLNRYAPDGTPLDSHPLEFSSGIPMAWQDDAAGRIVSQVRPFSAPGQGVPDSMDVLVLRGSAGDVRDTLLRVRSGGTFAFSDSEAQLTFFAPEPVWTLVGDGEIVFAVNDAYELEVHRPDGTLARIIRKAFERNEVSEADRELMTEAILRLYEEFGISGEQLEFVRRSIGFADHYPAFASIRGGPEGSIWVQHLQVPSDLTPEEREGFDPRLGFGSSAWDVFDVEGQFLGVLEFPPRYQPLRVEGERIFGLQRDELDVQHVVILELRRGA